MLNNFLQKSWWFFTWAEHEKYLSPEWAHGWECVWCFVPAAEPSFYTKGPQAIFSPPLSLPSPVSLLSFMLYIHIIFLSLFFFTRMTTLFGNKKEKKKSFSLFTREMWILFFCAVCSHRFRMVRYKSRVVNPICSFFSLECLQQPLLSIRVIILSRFVVVESYDTHENVTVEEDMG